MKNIFLLAILLFIGSCNSEKPRSIDFQLNLEENYGIRNPIAIDVSGLDFSNFRLLNEGEAIPFDVDESSQKMWFVHDPNRSDTYRLTENSRPKDSQNRLSASKRNGNLVLGNNRFARLSYRYEMHYPPTGVDSIFRKSGYIHPIITPKGDTLTRINPPDHWHHYGVWGPWTHTRIDTTRVDFWNLGDGHGTVLFKKFNSITKGQISSGFSAAQEHIDFKTQKDPQVALNENLQIKLWDLGQDDRYMLDYTTSFTTPLEKGILFEAYRYGGGLGMRFTERWHKENCEVLTSEGEDRLTADGTNARWAMVTGASRDGKRSNGILFLSYPKNRMHPEPMRVWPIDGNGGRGDMFFEFCPIRHEEWKIEPGQQYELRYRMVVFEGKLSKEEAEEYWQTFANPPQLKQIGN